MAGIAREQAEAIRAEFGAAVDLLGISSGGSVALQLAADHPDVVGRLILASAGYRLGTAAKGTQLRYVEAAAAGRGAQFLAVDFAHAEDAFDLGPRLGEITAPTLVIAGERDRVYSPEIFHRTAQDVRRGQLIVLPDCVPDWW
jgi:pimeloyl-ACP methyl ester carboxylesterase